MMSKKFISIFVIYILGIIIRLWLFYIDFDEIFTNRVEISTPLNSWRRVIEAIHISKISNVPDPYESEVIYEPPFHHLCYKILINFFGDNLYLVFIFVDILTTFCLFVAGKTYLENIFKKENSSLESYSSDALNFILKESEINYIDEYIVAAYMLNPYIIFNCVGCTTTVFSNFFTALLYVGIVKESLICIAFPLAMIMTQTFYPVLLIAPIFVIYNKNKRKAALTISLTFAISGLIIYLSNQLNPKWSYLKHSLQFILSAPDFTPNIGLFWYFFIEMFEHFRTLFIYSFQINVTALYVIPLTLRFREDPVLLTTSLIGITTIFKSYPSIGEVGFVLALLPFWKHLQFYMQQGFLISITFFMVTFLAPTVWYLWLYSGSANANFYFGATLAFATAQIFMLTDLLFAYIKREYIIKHGCVREHDGQEALLLLE